MSNKLHDNPLRILIVGAGGIGAYYGARLHSAGHPVTFVVRGEHLRALSAGALRIEHPQFSFDSLVDAVSVEQLIDTRKADTFDLLLLTTKAGSTTGLMEQLGPWLRQGNNPAVLSLQNGIDNEPAIAQAVGQARTLGGLAVRIGGHVIAPGRVEATGPAEVITGAWPNAQANTGNRQLLTRIETQFNRAHIPTRLTDDIQLELWKKLLINNGVNPLSALTGLDTRTLSNHPQLGRSVFRLMQEAAAAAQADGIAISSGDVDAMYRLICTFDPIKTSMLVDYEKGRPLELDEIAGAVCQRAQRMGESAPVTELVRGLLQLKLDARNESAN